MYKIAAVGNLPHIRALALVGVDWFSESDDVEGILKQIISSREYAILIVSDEIYNNYQELLEKSSRPEFSVVILGKDEEKASKALEKKIERALGIRIFE